MGIITRVLWPLFFTLLLILTLGFVAGCDGDDDDDNDDNDTADVDDDDDDDASGADDDDDDDDDDTEDPWSNDEDDGLGNPNIELLDGGVPGEGGNALAPTGDGAYYLASVKARQLLIHLYRDGAIEKTKRLSRFAASPTVAVDASGVLHVAYVNTWAQKLLYANDRGGAWTWQTVDDVDETRADPSIAVDAAGAAHIAYLAVDRGLTSLRYATNASGTWQTTTVDGTGAAPYVPAMYVSDGGLPVILFCNVARLLVVRAAWSEKGWETTEIGQIEGYPVGLGMDAAGHVFAYSNIFDAYNFTIYMVATTNAGGTWTSETLDAVIKFGGGGALAANEDGRAAFAYAGQSGEEVFAVYDGAAWTLHESPARSAFESPMAMIWDGDRAVLLYTDYLDLNMLTLAGEDFTLETIDSSYISGNFPSLEVDSQGRMHTLFNVTSTDRTAGYMIGENGTWGAQELPITTTVYPDPQTLALDAGDEPHFLYINGDFALISHAFHTAEGWSYEPVVTGSFGDDYDFAIAHDGTLWTAVSGSNSIEVMYRDDDDWVSQAIGPYTSPYDFKLVAGPGDTVLLSMVDSYAMMVATVDREGSDREGVYIGSLRPGHDFWTTPAGVAYLVTNEENSETYLVCDNQTGDWRCEDTGIESYPDYLDPALTVDDAGHVYFTYFVYTDTSLRLATNRSGEWVSTVVDFPGGIGNYSAVRFTPDGALHIVYSGASALWHVSLSVNTE